MTLSSTSGEGCLAMRPRIRTGVWGVSFLGARGLFLVSSMSVMAILQQRFGVQHRLGEAENSYTLTTTPVGRSVTGTMWVTRLVAVYLLCTVALLMVPKADIPETPFDEGDTQTNEMVVVKATSLMKPRQSVTVSVPIMFAQSRKISVCIISPDYTGQLTDSCRFQELLCSLLC